MAYTKAQEARLKEFDEITYLDAVALGVELDKSTKSICSKAQHLEIPYIKKAVPAPKPPQATKAELVDGIETFFEGTNFQGLLGATRDSLVLLCDLLDTA